MRNKLFYLMLSTSVVIFSSCDNLTTSFGLKIGSSNFNRMNDNEEFESVPDAMFKSGEIVYLMLFDVSGFEKGKDGKHQIEMEMKVTAADGSVIIEEKDMLGEEGHVLLTNNTAPNPSTSFTPPNNLPTGEYTFYVKIIDAVNGGYASVSKKFIYR